MDGNNFFEQLRTHLDLPFTISEVSSIESNCGTIWIELNNGKIYFLEVQPCEDPDE